MGTTVLCTLHSCPLRWVSQLSGRLGKKGTIHNTIILYHDCQTCRAARCLEIVKNLCLMISTSNESHPDLIDCDTSVQLHSVRKYRAEVHSLVHHEQVEQAVSCWTMGCVISSA
jgi:hypothetical protein